MRRLIATDRVVVLLLGLGLVAGGLVGLDWGRGLVLDLQPAIRTGSAQDAVDAGWWPWASGVVGVLLAVLALLWLLAHARRPGPATVRLAASDSTGRVEVDVRSLAQVAADRLATLVPVQDPSGATRTARGTTVVELRGRIDPDVPVADLAAAAARCVQEIEAAFPDEAVACRVVLDAPRRGRSGRSRTDRIRVQ